MNTLRALITACLVAASVASAGLARADIVVSTVAFTCEGENLKFTRTCGHSVGGGAQQCREPAKGDPVYGCTNDSSPRIQLGTVSSFTVTHSESMTGPGGTTRMVFEGEGTIDAPCSTLHDLDEMCVATSCGSYNDCGDVPANLPAAKAGEDSGSSGCAIHSPRKGIAAGFGIVFGLAMLMASLRRKNASR